MAIDVNKMLLNMPLPENDAGALTVKDYLKLLLRKIWEEEEGFNGKRPFGNSGWQNEIYLPMLENGFVSGQTDSDGWLTELDYPEANTRILSAIDSL